ncbi:VOC family protein [Aquincola sp. S2]|uniref:VOC family protein n=2 Tax=Pseudaquabacterium terrae TaxID=2732868 RepID=A0ABX2EBK0_9BURK|nr:VOC family protein [Aquabacterium terrae]
MHPNFNGVKQVGYVVKDLDKAMRHWVDLGIGPWFYRKNVTPVEFRYYGETLDKPVISGAIAQSGDIQIELLQQCNDAPSLYRDSLERSGEIAQHVAFWTVNEYDRWCRRLLELGYVEGHAGRMDSMRGRFAYFVHLDFPSAMIEISESLGGKAETFERFKQAALNWDGRDPLRMV